MDRNQLLEQALALGEEGDWLGAAELLRDHLEDFAQDAGVLCWLGVAEQELGMGGVAYERFKHALSLGSDDPYVLATAGNGIAYFDDPEAENTLRTAALIAPDLPVTRLMYGTYLAREGFTDQAIEELTAARELDPDDPQIAYELGVAWDDPAIGADWGVADPQRSDRGTANPLRADLAVDMIPAFRDPLSGAGERV